MLLGTGLGTGGSLWQLLSLVWSLEGELSLCILKAKFCQPKPDYLAIGAGGKGCRELTSVKALKWKEFGLRETDAARLA